jgi:alpha-L-fucosidase
MTRRDYLNLMAGLSLRFSDCPSPALPTPGQLAWQQAEFGMFIHFAPNTYNDTQGDLGGASDPRKFNPYKLDTEQWVDVAQSMGARYIILVAKHVGGFCLWPTATTHYSIASSPYKNGKGDIVGELSASCRKRGMKFGAYISPRDDHRGVGGGGKVRSGMAEDQRRYDEIYRQQLTELLSNYGDFFEIWFDGSASGDLVGPVVRQYQPNAMVFQSSVATIRWVGNEDGLAPDPLWNMVSNADHQTGEASGAGSPNGDAWLPAECDVPIRKDWFWSTTNESSLKTLDQLMTIYEKSVGRGANLLLNHTPDRTGLIPAPDVKRAAEFGAEIQRRFGKPIAETKQMELSFDKETPVAYVVLAEDIAQGQRIRRYRVEAQHNGAWQTIANGQSVGHKKIHSVNSVTTQKLRLIVSESVCAPVLSSFAAFKA